MGDERALLERWKAGDRAAGDELLDRYFDRVYRFFLNKVDRDVEELLQRTFLACVESIDRYRGDGSFRSFLFAIARNELRQWFVRKNRGRREIDLGSSSVVDLGTSPVTQVARHERQQQLLDALRSLPADLQLVLELHYWEGLTTEELGRVIDVPTGTVKSRLRRAREQLAQTLRRRAPAMLTADELDARVRELAAVLRPPTSNRGG